MKLIVLCGPPGSGKSSYANQLVTQGYSRVSQDDYGKEGHLKKFQNSIKEKDNIVVDRLNFDKNQRNRYIEPARKAGYEIEIVVFHVPRQTCFDRIMARENHPTINGMKTLAFDEDSSKPTHVIFLHEEKERQANSALDTFFTKYERVEDSEADKVTRLGWDGPKVLAVGSDLDGTLCNIDHRLKHVQNEDKKKRRWDLFNKEICNDSVNNWCASILELYSRCTTHPIILCSGRVDSSKKDTEEWLKKHDIPYDYLFMRHRSDFRDDTIVKQIMLEFEIKPRFELKFMLDDRPKVIRMWRENGIVCLACNDKEF